MKALKFNRATGPRGISNKLIKHGKEKLNRIIHRMFLRAINGDRNFQKNGLGRTLDIYIKIVKPKKRKLLED